MSGYAAEERRGADTEKCHTELLPLISFDKLRQAREAAQDPSGPIHALGRFAILVFEERLHRSPEPTDTIELRDNDDLAIAAMFDLRHPDINRQVRQVFHDLGIIAQPEGGAIENSPV